MPNIPHSPLVVLFALVPRVRRFTGGFSISLWLGSAAGFSVLVARLVRRFSDMIDVANAWYLIFFSFGCLCAWAVIKGWH